MMKNKLILALCDHLSIAANSLSNNTFQVSVDKRYTIDIELSQCGERVLFFLGT